MKGLELYLYSPYGSYGLYRASVPAQGCTLPLTLPMFLRANYSQGYNERKQFVRVNLLFTDPLNDVTVHSSSSL